MVKFQKIKKSFLLKLLLFSEQHKTMNIASSNVKHTNCYKKDSYIILDEVSAIATSQVKGWLSFFLVPFSCFSPSIVSTTSPMTYGFFLEVFFCYNSHQLFNYTRYGLCIN